MTKTSRGGTAIAVFLIAAFLLVAWSPWTSGNDLGAFSAPANAKPKALGDLGPGVCWPKDERPSGVKNPKAGFAQADGPTRAAAWFTNPPKDRKIETTKQLDNYNTWLDTHKDYYLVTQVVPNWNKLGNNEANKRNRVIAYIGKMKAVELKQPWFVTNTDCDNAGGKIDVWESQTLPAKEWVFFIPGHEPGSEDPRPAFKAVCGNPLLPPGKGTPPAEPTATPSTHPKCEKGCLTTPPPGCVHGCTTTPPPSGKKPNEAPGNGGEGDGGKSQYGGTGSDRQQVTEPASPPKANNPPPKRDNPPPPPADPPPAAKPAPSKPAPPPATGAPAPTAAPTRCVNPPGMNVCD